MFVMGSRRILSALFVVVLGMAVVPCSSRMSFDELFNGNTNAIPDAVKTCLEIALDLQENPEDIEKAMEFERLCHVDLKTLHYFMDKIVVLIGDKLYNPGAMSNVEWLKLGYAIFTDRKIYNLLPKEALDILEKEVLPAGMELADMLSILTDDQFLISALGKAASMAMNATKEFGTSPPDISHLLGGLVKDKYGGYIPQILMNFVEKLSAKAGVDPKELSGSLMNKDDPNIWEIIVNLLELFDEKSFEEVGEMLKDTMEDESFLNSFENLLELKSDMNRPEEKQIPVDSKDYDSVPLEKKAELSREQAKEKDQGSSPSRDKGTKKDEVEKSLKRQMKQKDQDSSLEMLKLLGGFMGQESGGSLQMMTSLLGGNAGEGLPLDIIQLLMNPLIRGFVLDKLPKLLSGDIGEIIPVLINMVQGIFKNPMLNNIVLKLMEDQLGSEMTNQIISSSKEVFMYMQDPRIASFTAELVSIALGIEPGKDILPELTKKLQETWNDPRINSFVWGTMTKLLEGEVTAEEFIQDLMQKTMKTFQDPSFKNYVWTTFSNAMTVERGQRFALLVKDAVAEAMKNPMLNNIVLKLMEDQLGSEMTNQIISSSKEVFMFIQDPRIASFTAELVSIVLGIEPGKDILPELTEKLQETWNDPRINSFVWGTMTSFFEGKITSQEFIQDLTQKTVKTLQDPSFKDYVWSTFSSAMMGNRGQRFALLMKDVVAEAMKDPKIETFVSEMVMAIMTGGERAAFGILQKYIGSFKDFDLSAVLQMVSKVTSPKRKKLDGKTEPGTGKKPKPDSSRKSKDEKQETLDKTTEIVKETLDEGKAKESIPIGETQEGIPLKDEKITPSVKEKEAKDDVTKAKVRHRSDEL